MPAGAPLDRRAGAAGVELIARLTLARARAVAANAVHAVRRLALARARARVTVGQRGHTDASRAVFIERTIRIDETVAGALRPDRGAMEPWSAILILLGRTRSEARAVTDGNGLVRRTRRRAAHDAVSGVCARAHDGAVTLAATDRAVARARDARAVGWPGNRRARADEVGNVTGLALLAARLIATHAVHAVTRRALVVRAAGLTGLYQRFADIPRTEIPRDAVGVVDAVAEASGLTAFVLSAVLSLHAGALAGAVAGLSERGRSAEARRRAALRRGRWIGARRHGNAVAGTPARGMVVHARGA